MSSYKHTLHFFSFSIVLYPYFIIQNIYNGEYIIRQNMRPLKRYADATNSTDPRPGELETNIVKIRENCQQFAKL